MIKGIDYQRDDEISLKMHVRMGDLTDDVVSLAYKVNRWVFDNETKTGFYLLLVIYTLI